MEMDLEIRYAYPRLGSRKMAPLGPNDWPAIFGRRWGNRGQSAANPGDPLSEP